LILASRNAHKVRELGELLPGFELKPLPDGIPSPVEDGETFSDNALIKARAARAAVGGVVIADDSGIEVDALAGAPGVRSARFAGEGAGDRENLEKLLREMEAAGGPSTARYVCVIALIDREGDEHLFEAACEGRMIGEPRGSGGFGYDPAFVPDETGPDDQRTMAELSPDEKHALSHRGRAARALAEHLEA
jgi:XTP/dITP diphosphohydrolase